MIKKLLLGTAISFSAAQLSYAQGPAYGPLEVNNALSVHRGIR